MPEKDMLKDYTMIQYVAYVALALALFLNTAIPQLLSDTMNGHIIIISFKQQNGH